MQAALGEQEARAAANPLRGLPFLNPVQVDGQSLNKTDALSQQATNLARQKELNGLIEIANKTKEAGLVIEDKSLKAITDQYNELKAIIGIKNEDSIVNFKAQTLTYEEATKKLQEFEAEMLRLRGLQKSREDSGRGACDWLLCFKTAQGGT